MGTCSCTVSKPAGSVWATNFENVKTSKEYPVVIGMYSFESLFKELCDKNICGISKLAIHAHGATDDLRVGGVVKLKNNNSDNADMLLKTDNMDAYGPNLKKINGLLTADAKVIFFCCATGYCDKGDEFLKKLSKEYFAGKTVIAFTTFLYMGKVGLGNTAGVIDDTRQFNTSFQNNPNYKDFKRAKIELDSAKWAKDGVITQPAKHDCTAKQYTTVPPCQKMKNGKEKYPSVCSEWKASRKDILIATWFFKDAKERGDEKAVKEWEDALQNHYGNLRSKERRWSTENNNIIFSDIKAPETKEGCADELKKKFKFDIIKAKKKRK
jgi:hypothetical protein